MTGHPRPEIQPLAAKFFRPSQLRNLRGREQVAAVCYQIRGGSIEFLLVRTRSGRWTFPKGGAEPGLTHAQSAALEAFEEGGVHGRMEEISFARYRTGKRDAGRDRAVHAHLCEVLRLGRPQEANRRPTWFPAERAKRCLRQDRPDEKGAELARIVDRAVSRIQRLHALNAAPPDALQKVQFEVSEETVLRGLIREDLLLRYLRRQRRDGRNNALVRGPVPTTVQPQLSAGDVDTSQKSQVIEMRNPRRDTRSRNRDRNT